MKKQNGFTLIEGLLIVLVLSFLGFAGYYVWNQQNDENTNVSTNAEVSNSGDTEKQTENSQEVDISANWKRFTSGNDAYSIKLVDGMSGYRDTTTDFITVRSYEDNDSSAELTDLDGYGSDAYSVLTVFHAEDPQWFSSTEKLEFKEVDFTTSSGVKGKKQTFKTPYSPPCEGPDCYVGTEYVNYEFKNEETGFTTQIIYSRRFLNEETAKVYGLKQDDPDLSAEIDAVAKSLEIN